MKSGSNAEIQKLSVGNKTYSGNLVCEEFFDSLSALKEPNMSKIHSSASFLRFKCEYDMIIFFFFFRRDQDFYPVRKWCQEAALKPEIWG